MIIEAAAEAFREFILPAMGMLTIKSQLSRTSLLHTVALGAYNDRAGACEIRAPKLTAAAGCRAVDPNALILKLLENGRNARHACYLHVLGSTGRSLADDGRKPSSCGAWGL